MNIRVKTFFAALVETAQLRWQFDAQSSHGVHSEFSFVPRNDFEDLFKGNTSVIDKECDNEQQLLDCAPECEFVRTDGDLSFDRLFVFVRKCFGQSKHEVSFSEMNR